MQLIHGDCLEKMKDIPDGKYIIVSDPPFNIGYHYNSYKDKMDENDYYKMLSDVFSSFPHVIIHYPEALYKHSFNIGVFPERVVSWVYNSNTQRQHRDIAFFGVKPAFTKCGQPYKNPTDKRIAKRIAEGKTAKLYDWWEINQVKNVSLEKTEHPCQMPVEVMERIIKILPDEYTIIDPFMGSGSTGIACINTNRNFIGIEKDDKYFEIAKKRIEEHLTTAST
jgi:DNA modification methylase